MDIEQRQRSAPVADKRAAASETPRPAGWKGAIPDILFWVVLVVLVAMGVQLFVAGSGEPSMRMFAFLATMAIPVGTAYWGKRTGMWGPSVGALALMALYWLSMNLGDLYTNY